MVTCLIISGWWTRDCFTLHSSNQGIQIKIFPQNVSSNFCSLSSLKAHKFQLSFHFPVIPLSWEECALSCRGKWRPWTRISSTDKQSHSSLADIRSEGVGGTSTIPFCLPSSHLPILYHYWVIIKHASMSFFLFHMLKIVAAPSLCPWVTLWSRGPLYANNEHKAVKGKKNKMKTLFSFALTHCNLGREYLLL